jgi:hypothetical protein
MELSQKNGYYQYHTYTLYIGCLNKREFWCNLIFPISKPHPGDSTGTKGPVTTPVHSKNSEDNMQGTTNSQR